MAFLFYISGLKRGLAKQSIHIMFTSFLFEKLTHLKQFYSSEDEFIKHLMSGEVKVSIPDLIKFQSEYEASKPLLPSRCQINQVVNVKWRENDSPFTATIRGVRFYKGKVKYDVGLWLGDGTVDNPETEERVYNIDSVFVTPA